MGGKVGKFFLSTVLLKPVTKKKGNLISILPKSLAPKMLGPKDSFSKRGKVSIGRS